MPYKVTISTKAYKPMRATKQNWEPGTTNDHVQALDGFQCMEMTLTEVGWRLEMFAGTKPWDVYDTPYYKAWLYQGYNTLTYHDRLCDIDRTTEICPPGFKQGYMRFPFPRRTTSASIINTWMAACSQWRKSTYPRRAPTTR